MLSSILHEPPMLAPSIMFENFYLNTFSEYRNIQNWLKISGELGSYLMHRSKAYIVIHFLQCVKISKFQLGYSKIRKKTSRDNPMVILYNKFSVELQYGLTYRQTLATCLYSNTSTAFLVMCNDTNLYRHCTNFIYNLLSICFITTRNGPYFVCGDDFSSSEPVDAALGDGWFSVEVGVSGLELECFGPSVSALAA